MKKTEPSPPFRARRAVHAGLALFAILAASCAPRYVMYGDGRFPPLGIPAGFDTVRILDPRPGLEKIDLPFMDMRASREFHAPLGPEDSAAIRGQVARNSRSEGSGIFLDIRIEAADAGYRISFMHGTAHVRAKVAMDFLSAQGKIASCTGSSELEKGMPKLTAKELRNMNRENLMLSAYKCLESFRDEVGKGTIRLPADPKGPRI